MAEPEWMAVQDPNSGRTYYANMHTRETRWDPPPNYQGPTQPQVQWGQSESQLSMVSDGQSFYGSGPSMQNFNQQQQQPQQPMQQQPPAQQQQPQQQQPMDQGGLGFNYAPSQSNFYGAQSQASLYQPSQSFIGSEVGAPAGGDPNSKWREAFDPGSGRKYYYHVDTKETQWTMPPELSGSLAAPDVQNQKRLSAQLAVQSIGESVTNFQTQAWEDSDDDDEDEESGSGSWGDDDDKDDDDDSSSDDGGLAVYDPTKAGQPDIPTNVIDDPSSSSDDEENKGIDPIAEDEEVLVDDDVNKYWTIGETQGDKYKLIDYGERNFQKDKHKKSMFKKMEVSEMLEWSNYKKMSNALRKLDSKLNSQAKQTWKNVNSYMGDRGSSKGTEGHIDKLLRFALKAPEELRDEIYCQLCKQTNKNPKAQSLRRGWQLMCICCSVFPPSDEFACYLASYLYERTNAAGEVGEFSTFALKALDRTMDIGQRHLQPMPQEIQRIEERQPISIKVHFLDGTFRTTLITSQTRASQVEKSMAEAFRLNHTESFGLFEMEEPKQGWEKAVYDKRAKMERQQKIDELQHMPYDRELELNERIMDVVSSWTRSKKKQKRKIRFVYKCKIISKAQESTYSRMGWKIAFITSVWHVLHGYYPVEQKHAFQLAALHLQAHFGTQDKDFYVPGVIADSVEKFLPFQYLHKFRPSEAEGKILEQHVQYRHLDRADGYRKYIEFLRTTAAPNYFGLEMFRCVRVSRLKKAKIQEEDDVIIGIGENGVVFLGPMDKKIVSRYKMEEILTYGFRSNAFLFVAGTLMTQRKYQFATMLGKQMNDLLRAHIDLRVQQAEVQGYSIQQ